MAKYIDADLLRKEIEKERKSIDGLFTEGDNSFYDGQDDAYNHTLALIESLQQEQPSEVDEEGAKEDAQESGFLVLGEKCYCPNCYQYDDDDNIVTKDGKKFNGDTYEEIKEEKQ